MDKRKKGKTYFKNIKYIRTYCNQTHDTDLSMQMVLDSIFHLCNFTHSCCL